MDIKSCVREFHGLMTRDEKKCLDKLFLHNGISSFFWVTTEWCRVWSGEKVIKLESGMAVYDIEASGEISDQTPVFEGL